MTLGMILTVMAMSLHLQQQIPGLNPCTPSEGHILTLASIMSCVRTCMKALNFPSKFEFAACPQTASFKNSKFQNFRSDQISGGHVPGRSVACTSPSVLCQEFQAGGSCYSWSLRQWLTPSLAKHLQDITDSRLALCVRDTPQACPFASVPGNSWPVLLGV